MESFIHLNTILQEHKRNFSGWRYPQGFPGPLRTALGPRKHSQKGTGLMSSEDNSTEIPEQPKSCLPITQSVWKGEVSESHLCWAVHPERVTFCFSWHCSRDRLTQRWWQKPPPPSLSFLLPLFFLERQYLQIPHPWWAEDGKNPLWANFFPPNLLIVLFPPFCYWAFFLYCIF